MSKFKVGDRVRVTPRYNANPRQAGREFTIASDEGMYDGEQSWSGGSTPYRFKESDLEFVNFSPVRLVTRKEIVSGVFGRVRVLALAGVSDKRVGVRITSDDAALGALSEAELRAAAATFIELADALALPLHEGSGE